MRNENQDVPPEVARIRSGAVVAFMGMSVNAGIYTWAGYDADRAVFVSITGSSGARAPAIPVARGKLLPNQFIRAISIGQIRRTEVVTVAAASSWQAQEFACLANLLMAAPIENIPRVVDLDGLEQFELRLSGSRVDVGAGIARFRLERAIGSLIRDAVRESEADGR
ncbi:hypothetical protein PFX98_09625 [Paucibacter sediminis]|uniref:Uncharacterized protein n=1 Tax=Paucibacter sediminis TaxID=3019553 RepID=A0AA95NIH8_9BURK|nr:hypothetical protein [Paucibacter sp. S2-9]WIT13862.1 hypothetical protein PFX98_09625 [Paucibacter sp. S2-9]